MADPSAVAAASSSTSVAAAEGAPLDSTSAVEATSPGPEPFRPTLATLFSMALSHGAALSTEELERWAYDRFFQEVELTDVYFSRTGVSSLVLHCLWDRYRCEATDRMNADGFAVCICEISRRCYQTMSGKPNSPVQQAPTPRGGGFPLTVNPHITAGRTTSFLAAGDLHLTAAEMEASKEFLFAIEFVFAKYIKQSVFQPNVPHTIENSDEWSRLTRDVVTHSLRQAMPSIQLFFDEFADTEGFIALTALIAMVRAMGIHKDFVDDELIEAIFHQVNHEDTKGLEHGELFDELELDLVVAALGLMAFAAFSDDTLYPRHVTVQSRIFSLFEIITTNAATRFGSSATTFSLPARFRRSAADLVEVPVATGFAPFDPKDTTVQSVTSLDPALSAVVPRVLSLSVLEGFFVAGAHFLTPIIDDTMLSKELPWDSLLGRRNRATRTVAYRLRQALREVEEAEADDNRTTTTPGLQHHADMGDVSMGANTSQQGARSPLQQIMDDEAAEELRIREAHAREDAMAKTVFGSAKGPTSTVLRDAQWLMSSTFDPPATKLGRAELEDAERHARSVAPGESRVIIWCGGVPVKEAYCVATNRIRATPTPASLQPNADVAIITAACRGPDRLDIGFQPAQRVAVQVSRTLDGPKSQRSIWVVLSRASMRGQHVGGRDAAVFYRLFEIFSVEVMTSDATQRYMTWADFERAKKLLELPEATHPPRFPCSAPHVAAQAHQGGKFGAPCAAAWSTIFELFAAPLPLPSETSNARKPVLRTTVVQRCPDEVGKVVHRGGLPSNALGGARPVLTVDGFLLSVLYGLAGSVMDQRASAVTVEFLAIRLKAMMSYPKVRAAAVPPPPQPPPTPAAPVLSEPTSPLKPAPPTKPKKKGRGMSPKKKEGTEANKTDGGKDAKKKGGKGKKKKDAAQPTVPLPQGPQPILLPDSAFQGSPHRRRDPIITFTSPQFVEAAFQKVLEENPPSKHLKLKWRDDPDADNDAVEQQHHAPTVVDDETTPARSARRVPQQPEGERSAPRRLHLLEATDEADRSQCLPRMHRDLLDGTTAKLHPVEVATPRRGNREPGKPDDLSGIDPMVLPPLETSPIAVPAIVPAQLADRVKDLSTSLRKEYFDRSMLRVQNHPQYSLKSFY